ncbi:MAG: SRPBCC family protein [Bacteroidales bacterium]|nr:SRPBCC family protein [Bacteroidales bacterium]MCB9012689.1 SRPBCC family protein [Bacteroidales bacterium]
MNKFTLIALFLLIISLNLNVNAMNIKADSTAKCYASSEIIINASNQHVFEILSNIKKWPEWQSSVIKVEIDGNAEVDKTFKWKAGGLNIKSKLHTVNPDSEIGWTGRIWWIKAVHNWYLTEEGGQTKVIVKESLKGLGSSMMRKSLEEGMKKNLDELKIQAEKS